MTVLEARHNVAQGIIWLGILALAGFAALLLATNLYYLLLLGSIAAWIVTIPYHTKMSALLSFSMLNASFIVPFIVQRPTFEEIAVILAWTGIPLTLALRRAHPDTWRVLRTHRWMWISYLAFALLVFFIMRHHNVGFGVAGSSQMGGRRYLRQLTSVAAPFAFLMILPGEKMLKTLFNWHCLLSLTFVVAEFALSIPGGLLIPLLYFVELPYDALSFAAGRGVGGVDRYQSLQLLCQAGLVFVGTLVSFNDLARRKAVIYGPIVVFLLALGLISGHRYAIFFAAGYLIAQGLAQRFLNLPRILLVLGFAAVMLAGVYTFARQLPLSVQRALCVLPQFPAEPIAMANAKATMDGRKHVRDLAWAVAPQYRWIGRGFSSYSGDVRVQNDSLMMHLAAGIWYNGSISLMINTGIPGLVLALFFIGCGVRLCFYLIALCRRVGFDDSFARMTCSMACWWLVLAFSLVFVEGSAEQILSQFGIITAFLIACHVALHRRLGYLPAAEVER